jgi:hypothetical protein
MTASVRPEIEQRSGYSSEVLIQQSSPGVYGTPVAGFLAELLSQIDLGKA